MRPSLLDPLFSDITTLDGVGAKTAELIANVVPMPAGPRDPRVGDLLFVLPHGLIDRRNRPEIASAPGGSIVTLSSVASRLGVVLDLIDHVLRRGVAGGCSIAGMGDVEVACDLGDVSAGVAS